RRYLNMSRGEGDTRGSWNEGDGWEYVEAPQPALDGGDGTASVNLSETEQEVLQRMADRTRSDPMTDPLTGADLGAGAAADKAP
ncbi:manganese catalase family protein, partial [Pseudomonas aeruginosa]|nr:manganese catalase family protein [Pseudomonas aeruginosa]